MSYEIRVAETDHGDGFGPDPTVTLTVNGSHDVSRLVHLLSKSGNSEQGRVLDELVEKLRSNPGGLDTLRMLREHGGNDYTGEVLQQWAVRHPKVRLSVHRSRDSALYTLSRLPGGVLVTRMSDQDDDAWKPEHVHADDCMCVMVPMEVEGASECHYCGGHTGGPCGDRCDIARAEVIARG